MNGSRASVGVEDVGKTLRSDIYQLIRNIAGKHMKFHEFVAAMILTVILTGSALIAGITILSLFAN